MTQSPVPTDAALSARLAQLTPAQRALFERKLRERSASSAPSVAPARIERRATDEPAVLTPAQELLWTLDQAMPGLVAYNVPRVLRIEGELDVAALQRALDALVARHDALRTRFVATVSGPRQAAAPASAVPLETIDLRTLPAGARAAESDRIIGQRARLAFDLSRDLLLRATVVREDETVWRLLLLTHHIVCDEGSRDVTLRELGALYAAALEGREAALPALPIRFSDYAAWQRTSLDSGALAEQVRYWRDRLQSLPALDLPTDRPRTSAPAFAGARVRRVLTPAVLEQARRVSREHGTTLYVTLLAAIGALLHRYTGAADVGIASPVTGRAMPELEGLIGYFPNVVVMRSTLSSELSFSELLRATRDTVLGAFEHQDVPLEAALERGGAASLTPVAFALQGEAGGSLTLPGARVTAELTDLGTAKFDLLFGAAERDDGLLLALEHRLDLYDSATAERMLDHLVTLLEGALAAPSTLVGDLPLMPEAERRLVLETWNDTAAPYPRDATMASLFAEQARRTPDAIALVHGDEALTYAELETRVIRLANHLRLLGAGPEVRVGVCLARTPELVVALLAVLTAGAAYVPVDPAYPEERVAFMLEDSAAPIVVTERASQRLVAGHATHVVVLDDDAMRAAIATMPATVPEPGARPDSLAYLIYTSGSTGRPKGVAIEHRNAVSFIAWAQTVFTRDELSGVLAATSVCFDLSVFELFVTLSSGGTVILADSVLAFPSLPAASSVTLVNTVPSAMAELVAAGLPASVRTVNLAGEPLPTSLVDRLYALRSVERVYDLYGPSEDTTYSTFTLRRPGAPATIGRPIANTRAYVLDERRVPRPIGVPGELYLGGAGLARGYLNRPELTAERFLFASGLTSALSSADANAERLYRTGDRVRWRADGTLEYLGRLDFMVKVRGYRIELGEIEASLAALPQVEAAVVAVQQGDAGDPRLVAYVVPRDVPGDATLGFDQATLHAWRTHLASTLPEYMMPAAFVRLDELPRTPNGKVDRRALRAPSWERTDRPYVEPRTPTEIAVAAIMAESLGVERVGVTDGFLDLGGHSLLAMRVVGRIRRDLGRVLPLSSLLRGDTLGQIAALLDAARTNAHEASDADDEFALVPSSRDAYRRGSSRPAGGGA